jgi:hypothetical protein
LKVRDEAGNVTTLSPHNFSMIPKSDPMAWSFYSENNTIGKKVNVDMLKAMTLLEQISGEKLVFIRDLNDSTLLSTQEIEESNRKMYEQSLNARMDELTRIIEKQAGQIQELNRKLDAAIQKNKEEGRK